MDTSPIVWTWEYTLADAKITDVERDGRDLTIGLDCSWTALDKTRYIRRLRFENCAAEGPEDLVGRFWFRARVTRSGAKQRLRLTTADIKDHKRDYTLEFSRVTAEK